MVSTKNLAGELRDVVGDAYVFSKPEDLLVYENDGSVDRALPQVVAVPGSAEEVAAVVRIAQRHGVPIVPRGAGTGLSGGAISIRGGILLPLTRLTRILEIDPVNQTAVVETGVPNLDVSKAVEPYGLRYTPD
ncbi:MAG: FAD-binding oxidoreductase, partial [Dehalococcoidia bacterium]